MSDKDYGATLNLPKTSFQMKANLPNKEPKFIKMWQEQEIYFKGIDKDKPSFILHDGPPYANGEIHIGHALNKILKDIILKYKRLRGYNAPYIPGWDTHGLPIELKVTEKLGSKAKEMTPAEIRELCAEYAKKWVGIQREGFVRLGVLGDWENPYLTLKPEYEAKQLEVFGELYENGYIFKGLKPIYWSPVTETALAEAEIEYKNVSSPSIYVKMKANQDLLDRIGMTEETWVVIWTTTPWTLPSNVALCVNPEETYCKVKAADGYVYYMAKALLDKVLGKLGTEETPAYEILETYKGTDLEYKEYVPLYEGAAKSAEKQHKKAHFVTCADYVTMSDGTGIVHIAPAFGEDDAQVGRKYDLPFVQFVDGKGNMTEDTPYAGLFVKDADPKVLVDLDKEGLLFDAPKFEHDYPFCWRCDTPLIYYARESWFIKMTAVKDDLIRNNNTINWIPKSIGKGRFGDWLNNIQDWGISRNRYWGTPLNVWQCEGCGKMECIGSRQELEEKSGNPEAQTVELHRPYIDAITLTCPDCGKTMKRVPEVIDCWFDSGAMPFAQHHYPFENKELFEQQFPAQFISEAVDQTRGWFYSLLAESTLLFNKAPYKNVIVLGHVQDENGQKMSKSKGNAVDPFDALEQHGADAIRWYFYSNSAPWLPNRFHADAVTEGQRKFMGTLWNTYAFYVLYANIDEFDPTKYSLEYDKLSVMDKWLLSRLNSCVKTVDDCLANYKIPETTKALQAFVDDMSNWYVRRSRQRFWAKGMEQDKINAYMTLYTALVTFIKASAPMIPFMTEDIYQNLVKSVNPDAPESIHLCDFPAVDEAMIDEKLEQDMGEVLDIVVLGRAARNASGIKNRQPIGQMFVNGEAALTDYYKQIIEGELNVKDVIFKDDVSDLTDYTFKPQMRILGPKYGKDLGKIRNILANLNGSAAKKELDANGFLTIELNDGKINLLPEELLIDMSQKEGYVSQADHGVTVVLDTNLTPALLEEGFVREIISKVQTMRKEAGFEVTDHITVYEEGNDKIKEVMTKYTDEIKNDVLADDMCLDAEGGYSKEWDINGEKVRLGVEKKM